MGSGNWFKTIIRRKKGKDGKSKQPKKPPALEKRNGATSKRSTQKVSILHVSNGASSRRTNKTNGILNEDLAAIRIQTAFRAYMARRALRHMKGALRLQILTRGQSVRKQSISALTHLHSWTRIQTQIKERRLYMVMEGRLTQKKLENQLKLAARLHDLEVEWCGGSETMEEILARIHQREEAAVKRERALAYAFSHQWRANSSQNQGPNASELGKANWGWSWKDRWIAARPWESRVPHQSISPKKGQNKAAVAGKNIDTMATQKSLTVKSSIPNGKEPAKARRLSFPGAEKPAELEANTKAQEGIVKKG
ncbi:hypothetical protein Nepgr_007330 [Nepenthes gracilis]|uniref:Protein IQ-DOMAIN 1 n=1 Tax=Nepenthes gracilis TaxID=150966 RepID=A0AAD3XI91_NEPGR|nr:hypothetical protein Nepgr_007330 [Nepenthes gracilis]